MPGARRLGEGFLLVARAIQIGGDHVLDRLGDVGLGHRRADHGADGGVLVVAAADGDLVELLAVLLDAQNADMADMVVAAGVDAAGNLDRHLAELRATSRSRKRRPNAWAIGMERALARLQ